VNAVSKPDRPNPASLVQDDPESGMFRVDRSIYTDPALLELEYKHIFEAGWVFLCHETQVANHGDYFSTHIGRQGVFVMRDGKGKLGCFVNACAHRGAVITPRKQGNAKTLTCRFHGWCFNSEGRCIKVKNEQVGWPDGFDKAAYGLTPVRIDTYRGFVFGSLKQDVPDLADHLGQMKPFIDLLADQSPDGMEVVRGHSSYIIRGNWKMQAENGCDGYHVSTVHRVFAAAMQAREERGGVTGVAQTEAGRIVGNVPTGCYDLGNGHIMVWASRTNPEAAPLFESRERLLQTFSPEKVRWMLERGRNLCVYPNVLLMDQPSTQIRVFRPLSVDRTEVTVFCIAPKGESRKARSARLRKFEDFYMVTGMATPDDLAALEDCENGSLATAARWNDMTRGFPTMVNGPDANALELGAHPVTSNSSWDHETFYRGFYLRWREMMTQPVGEA
jgi:benzoate/toluate 1,2-dioxygenase alpha subunit